jgi:GTP-binding protein
MGFNFLRHIQRTVVLIHLIDGTSEDPLADFSQVNSELALFDQHLSEKPQVVAVNKMDLPSVTEAWPALESEFKKLGYKPFAISALSRTGLTPSEKELPVYRLEEDPQAFQIMRDPDGAWRVQGKSVERAAAMTYWEYDEAVRRFQRILEHLGIEQALREAGTREGDTVRIGEYELEWQD